MTEGTSEGSDREAARLAGRDRHPADRFAGFLVFDRHGDRRSGAPQDLEQARARGIEAHALDVDDAARQPGGEGTPERRPGYIPRNPEAAALQALAAAEPDRQAVAIERCAERGQRPLRMIPCRGGLDDDGPARRMEAGQQDAALHLCARDVRPVGDALKGGALDRQRRPPVVRMDGRPHFGQRGDDPAHRPAGQGRVADDGRAEAVCRGQPRQQPHRGAGIGGVDRT